MRRAACLALLPVTLFACSYLYSASREATQDPMVLDEATPERSYTVRLCWTGEADIGDANVQVAAWAADGPGRVELRYPDDPNLEPWAVPAARPEDMPAFFWGGVNDLEVEDACSVGTTVSFALLDPSAGPVELEWSVIGELASTSDQRVEDLALELTVEPL